MKFAVLSLTLASVAMGELALFAPASSSVGIQCQGDCQNDQGVAPASSSVGIQCQGDCQNGSEGGNQAVAPQSDSPGAMHALVREFMGTEAPSSSVDSPNHILLEATPVIELLYNYMNPASAEEVFEAPQSKVSEVSADQGPINRLVAAFMNSDVEVAATAAPEDVYEYAVQPETLNEAMFDFNSWGDRVDSAAHRLVNNVEGIIVHFLPTSSVAAETGVIAAETDVIAADTGAIAVETDATVAPETDTVDARVEDITAATNIIGFNVSIDAEEAESSSAHWYEFL